MPGVRCLKIKVGQYSRWTASLLLLHSSTRITPARLLAMRSLLLAVLAAYVVAAIHAVLAFINKRRALQRVSEVSLATGFLLQTGALAADWFIDGHYPLNFLRETLSFLAWTLVACYLLILYRYRARP